MRPMRIAEHLVASGCSDAEHAIETEILRMVRDIVHFVANRGDHETADLIAEYWGQETETDWR